MHIKPFCLSSKKQRGSFLCTWCCPHNADDGVSTPLLAGWMNEHFILWKRFSSYIVASFWTKPIEFASILNHYMIRSHFVWLMLIMADSICLKINDSYWIPVLSGVSLSRMINAHVILSLNSRERGMREKYRMCAGSNEIVPIRDVIYILPISIYILYRITPKT